MTVNMRVVVRPIVRITRMRVFRKDTRRADAVRTAEARSGIPSNRKTVVQGIRLAVTGRRQEQAVVRAES